MNKSRWAHVVADSVLWKPFLKLHLPEAANVASDSLWVMLAAVEGFGPPLGPTASPVAPLRPVHLVRPVDDVCFLVQILHLMCASSTQLENRVTGLTEGGEWPNAP
eukprot:5945169-Prymnesium_polylepis.1